MIYDSVQIVKGFMLNNITLVHAYLCCHGDLKVYRGRPPFVSKQVIKIMSFSYEGALVSTANQDPILRSPTLSTTLLLHRRRLKRLSHIVHSLFVFVHRLCERKP